MRLILEIWRYSKTLFIPLQDIGMINISLSETLETAFHAPCNFHIYIYKALYMCRQTSDIWSTKSQILKDSHLVLQLSLPNPLKPDVTSEMKMELEQRKTALLNYIWVINKFITR